MATRSAANIHRRVGREPSSEYRMAKKQQMRWSDQRAHTLALVRVADLNEDLSAERFTAIARYRPGIAEKIDRAFYGVPIRAVAALGYMMLVCLATSVHAQSGRNISSDSVVPG